jgi:hypothetical protein
MAAAETTPRPLEEAIHLAPPSIATFQSFPSNVSPVTLLLLCPRRQESFRLGDNMATKSPR